MNSKPKVIKDFEKLTEEIQEQIKLAYPYGFVKHLIRYKSHDGRYISALPFETEDKYYLVRMTPAEATEILIQDDDYDESGELKDDIKEAYEEKYSDADLEDTDEGEIPEPDDSMDENY